MADISITSTWQAVAQGEGFATFEAMNAGIRWFVGSTTPETAGFSAKPSIPISLSLEAGQTLYLRGRGTAVVLAENAPV